MEVLAWVLTLNFIFYPSVSRRDAALNPPELGFTYQPSGESEGGIGNETTDDDPGVHAGAGGVQLPIHHEHPGREDDYHRQQAQAG